MFRTTPDAVGVEELIRKAEQGGGGGLVGELATLRVCNKSLKVRRQNAFTFQSHTQHKLIQHASRRNRSFFSASLFVFPPFWFSTMFQRFLTLLDSTIP